MAKIDKKEIDARIATGLPFVHRWHNRFHLEMPFGLINDPNGLTCKGGEYQIFLQWNPLGCEHKNKCWAHVETHDFIHYTTPVLAMWPSDAHDKDGCYSGCGFVEDGQVRVLYTCNAKDENDVRTPAQRLGTLREDGAVEKNEIVVPTNPAGFTGHFRDPYIFEREGQIYFVLGAQTEDLRGCVVLFRKDESDWTFLGELKTAKTDAAEHFGYMWECPNLLQFGEEDVLLFCPQGLAAEEYQYQNRHQSGYFVGKVSPEAMAMQHGEFQELDKGFDFYAPQVFTQAGRHILLGWMGMPDCDDEYPTKDEGWLYALTMPRELTLRDGHIYAQPVKEIEALRSEAVQSIATHDVQEFATYLAGCEEIILELALGEAKNISIALHYGEEKVSLDYDVTKQVMRIDRTGMKLGGKGVRKFKLASDGKLSLRLFLDKTAIEVFFQEGREVASFFVFPAEDVRPRLHIVADDKLADITGTVWALDGIKFA